MTSISIVFSFYMPYAERANIVRQAVSVGTPLLLGFLAITVASLALYASASTKEFMQQFTAHGMITKTFHWTIVVSTVVIMYAFVLFLSTFIAAFVDTSWFYTLAIIGLGLFYYVGCLVLGVAYNVTMQLLALDRFAKRSSS